MSNEEKRNSPRNRTLGGCLIEGDFGTEGERAEIKRRALAISVTLQCLVLVRWCCPLLGKTRSCRTRL